MKYIVEQNICDFEAWMGGRETLNALDELGEWSNNKKEY